MYISGIMYLFTALIYSTDSSDGHARPPVVAVRTVHVAGQQSVDTMTSTHFYKV